MADTYNMLVVHLDLMVGHIQITLAILIYSDFYCDQLYDTDFFLKSEFRTLTTL